MRVRLTVLPGTYAVSRLPPGDPIPRWLAASGFTSITRTEDELSIVCLEESVPAGQRSEGGWRCLKVHGPLPFSLTGVLAGLAAPLAEAGIPVFAVSTFDTDYLLLRETDLMRAADHLRQDGHQVLNL